MPADKLKKSADAPGSVNLDKVPLEIPEDGVFEAYSNVVNINWTLYDVRLRFSELIQVPDDERPTWENQHGVILERAAITLPWHQAKHLRDLLGGLIKSYEDSNGELKPVKLADRFET